MPAVPQAAYLPRLQFFQSRWGAKMYVQIFKPVPICRKEEEDACMVQQGDGD